MLTFSFLNSIAFQMFVLNIVTIHNPQPPFSAHPTATKTSPNGELPSTNPPAPPAQPFTADLSQWMTLLPAVIRATPLIHLAIPGSHDTMSYGIGRGSAAAPDAETIIAGLNRVLPCVVRRWARTQQLHTTAQLLAGIRYMDLRISVHHKDRRFYFVHGLYAEPIAGPLAEIAAFLRANSGEFVVLDCQHFYAFGEADYARLSAELGELFGAMVYGPSDGKLERLTLRAASEMGKQLLIIFRSDCPAVPVAHFWPSSSWPTPWPNQIRVERLQPILEADLQSRPPNAGYVTQCVLTPPVQFILPRFYSTLRRSCAETVRSKMFGWLRQQRPGCYRPGVEAATANVFIADFVDLNEAEFCRIVVGLNEKLVGDSRV